ncbi:rab3 gtpase-activating protein catalytic subunit [Anaeramoeba ignava]|uniref:Rab3 GTPase-activating protein catalytic subunit n=1 Tax=Anaeramoeba ignava TaxID=1746090 RepID=A0A9Q0LLE8_ANAIG|nr:rab3 gtpase-activating protein catalytic subunit [Anaeramoeba ignava]
MKSQRKHFQQFNDKGFEIHDFSVSSPWEKFISEIEMNLRKLSLDAVQYFSRNNKKQNITKIIEVNGKQTKLKYKNFGSFQKNSDSKFFPLMKAMMETKKEFSSPELLQRWFGLSEFIIIKIKDFSLNEASIILSSLSIALDNCGSPVPVFVLLIDGLKKHYIGYATHNNITTKFDSLIQSNDDIIDFPHLLDMFCMKLEIPPEKTKKISISSHFTYDINSDDIPVDKKYIGIFPYKQKEYESTINYSKYSDPISRILLEVKWPYFQDKKILEKDSLTLFNPFLSKFWRLRVEFLESPQCLLCEGLTQLMNFFIKGKKIESLLGLLEKNTNKTKKSGKIIGMFGRIKNSLQNSLSKKSPLPNLDIKDIIQDLFIFNQDENLNENENENSNENQKDNEKLDRKESLNLPRLSIKTAPSNTLISRLALHCAFQENLKKIAQIWNQFLIHLRWCWENGKKLPGIPLSPPDLRYSLIYQKLQMLNLCIEKKTREKNEKQNLKENSKENLKENSNENSNENLNENSNENSNDNLKDILNENSNDNLKDILNENDSTEVANGWDIGEDILDEMIGEDDNKQNHQEYIKENVNIEKENDSIESSGNDSDEDSQEQPDLDLDNLDVPDFDFQNISSDESENESENNLGNKLENNLENESKSESNNNLESESNNNLESESNNNLENEKIQNFQNFQPSGQLKFVDGMLLLKTGEKMWEPITQDPLHLTEDKLIEQQELFVRLGTSEHGANIRAQIQSKQLLADMQAFKAANKNSILEDFVRWYSPRDWIVDSSNINQGKLSSRMIKQNNIWVKTWEEANPIPAQNQKPLFDHIKEAEVALHYFDTLSSKEILRQLLGIAISSTVDLLINTPVSKCSKIKNQLINLINQINSLYSTKMKKNEIEKLIEMIQEIEIEIIQLNSLWKKLNGDLEMIQEFLSSTNFRIKINDERKREIVLHLFNEFSQENENDFSLPEPENKEFIFRISSPYPIQSSNPVSHRMYAFVSNGVLRISTAISESYI